MDLFLSANWAQLGVILGALIAASTVAGFAWTWAVKPGIALIKRTIGCLGRVEKYMGVLDNIAHEFQPNGGNSLRDILNRLETYVAISDTKIQSLMNYHGIASWETDAEGKCIWVSNELLQMWSCKMSDVMGAGWISYIAEVDRERVKTEWMSSVQDQRSFQSYFISGIEKPIQVVTRGQPIIGNDGTLKGYFGTVKPIKDYASLD